MFLAITVLTEVTLMTSKRAFKKLFYHEINYVANTNFK